ncbi:MAG TPA: trypsin-like peptidase domain-containing protein [Anaerolineales bacterium]|nr:trypsin-like peptidase domain-containing protein [Anaerolineales bacterium]
MKRKRSLSVLASVVMVAVTTLACQFFTPAAQNVQPSVAAPVTNNQPPLSVQAPINPLAAQDAFVALYQKVIPGVVVIKVGTAQGDALGAGFVYDADGHVVTNYHVVQGANANKAEVDFMDGYKAYGTVVGTDLDSDLAVLKVEAPATEFHPLTLGDSDKTQIGQTVIAIGNPFEYLGSMSVGVISGLHRTLESEHATPGGGQPFTAGDLLQTDTPINPGNSGGPLFNVNGEVIGVNRAIETNNFSSNGNAVNSGVGFSVSSNIIRRVAPVIIQSGRYDYPYLGISSVSLGNPSQGGLTLDQINALGLKQYTGTYVTELASGGPAEKAGLRVGTQQTSIQGLLAGGDLIVAIDGHPVIQYDDLISYLVTHKSPGDTIVLTVLRDGQKQDINLTLGKRPA